MTNPAQDPLEQKIGGLIFGLSIAFCGMEMVPRWAVFDLGWPPAAFVAIMAVSGAVSGYLLGAGRRLAGTIGGLVAGPGSLLAIAFVLERTTWTHTVILMAVAAIGALPGLGVYHALAAIERIIMPGQDDRATETHGPR